MAWVESHQEIGKHPKTKRAARLAGVSIPTMVGHLHLIWHYALDFAESGDVTHLEPWQIEDAAMWDGQEGLLHDALIDAGFIDAGESGERSLHDWNHGRHIRPVVSSTRRAWDAIRESVRHVVFSRDDFACANCGAQSSQCNPLEVDHIQPIAFGGDNSLSNLQTLCRSCNRSKGAKSVKEWQSSWAG